MIIDMILTYYVWYHIIHDIINDVIHDVVYDHIKHNIIIWISWHHIKCWWYHTSLLNIDIIYHWYHIWYQLLLIIYDIDHLWYHICHIQYIWIPACLLSVLCAFLNVHSECWMWCNRGPYTHTYRRAIQSQACVVCKYFLNCSPPALWLAFNQARNMHSRT